MNKPRFFLLALLAAALAGAPALPAATPDSEAEQAVTKLSGDLVAAFKSADLDRLAALLDTNAVITFPSGETCEGPAGLKASYARVMKGAERVVVTITADPKINGHHLAGDGAVLWGEMNDRAILADGRDLALNSRFTATLARRGDRWVISAFHTSVNPFQNAVLLLAVKKMALVAGIGGIVTGIIVGVVIVQVARIAKSGGK